MDAVLLTVAVLEQVEGAGAERIIRPARHSVGPLGLLDCGDHFLGGVQRGHMTLRPMSARPAQRKPSLPTASSARIARVGLQHQVDLARRRIDDDGSARPLAAGVVHDAGQRSGPAVVEGRQGIGLVVGALGESRSGQRSRKECWVDALVKTARRKASWSSRQISKPFQVYVPNAGKR